MSIGTSQIVLEISKRVISEQWDNILIRPHLVQFSPGRVTTLLIEKQDIDADPKKELVDEIMRHISFSMDAIRKTVVAIKWIYTGSEDAV